MREEQAELTETKVILVGADTGVEEDFEHSMEELKSLAEACGKKVVGIICQKLESVNQAYYIGSGKVTETKELADVTQAEEVIFDDTLTPSQMRNLGDALDRPVLDRTNLILDIFALRAQTKEAKLQVETAKLQYMLPRLIGMREALSRQGGASGAMSNKGAGETKLELDRRKIEHRISELRKDLQLIEGNRETMRKRREQSGVFQVALVGYTNAGKSTIMNRLVGRYGSQKEKTVLEKNMLFATLETSVRNLEFPDNKSFLLVDTVGFIHKLPHGLVKAFQSTLDEVKYSDLLVQVVDFSDPNHKQHMEVTEQTLKEIGASGIPQIIAYNKADLAGVEEIPKMLDDRIYMSAADEKGIEELVDLIKRKLYHGNHTCIFRIPYDQGQAASYLMENAEVREREYLEDGIRIVADCREKDRDKFRAFLAEE